MATVLDLGKKVRAKYPGAYDDLSDEQLGAKVKAKYPGAYDDFTELTAPATSAAHGPTAEAPAMPDVTGFESGGTKEFPAEAFARGAAQGASLGTAPQIYGGLKTAGAALGLGDTSATPLGEVYAREREAARAAQTAAQEAHPVAYGAGEVAGSMVPLALAPAGSAAARIASTAGAGAIQGAATSQGSLGERAEAAVKGAGAGAAAGGLGEAAGAVGRALLAKAGRGQLAELGATKADLSRIAKKVRGDPEAFEANTQSILAAKDVVDAMPGGMSWENARAARQQLGQDIGNTYKAASSAGARLTENDVIAAYLKATQGVASNIGEQAAAQISKEATPLLDKAAAGQLTPEAAHKWALDFREQLFGTSGMSLPQGTSKSMSQEFYSGIVDATRNRAREALGPEASATLDNALSKYGAHLGLERLAMNKEVGSLAAPSPFAPSLHNVSIPGLLPYIAKQTLGQPGVEAAGGRALQAVGPVARPIGATVAGYLGQKYGPKSDEERAADEKATQQDPAARARRAGSFQPDSPVGPRR